MSQNVTFEGHEYSLMSLSEEAGMELSRGELLYAEKHSNRVGYGADAVLMVIGHVKGMKSIRAVNLKAPFQTVTLCKRGAVDEVGYLNYVTDLKLMALPTPDAH